MFSIPLGDLVVRFATDSARFDMGIRSMESKLTLAARRMSRIGRELTWIVSAPLAGFGAMGIKALADFDHSMNHIMGLISLTNPMTAGLREEMMALARTISDKSVYSVGELGKAYEELFAAGLNAKQAMSALASVTQIGTVADVSATKAVEILLETQRKFGKDETLRQMALIMRMGKAEAGDLENQMKNLWAQFKNVSMEIGKDLVPYLQRSIDAIKEGIAWWRNLNVATQEHYLKMLLVAAGIGPVITLLGSLTSVVVLLSSAFLKLSGLIGINALLRFFGRELLLLGTTVVWHIRNVGLLQAAWVGLRGGILGLILPLLKWIGILGLIPAALVLGFDAFQRMTGGVESGLLDMVENFRVAGYKISTYMATAFIKIEDLWDAFVTKVTAPRPEAENPQGIFSPFLGLIPNPKPGQADPFGFGKQQADAEKARRDRENRAKQNASSIAGLFEKDQWLRRHAQENEMFGAMVRIAQGKKMSSMIGDVMSTKLDIPNLPGMEALKPFSSHGNQEFKQIALNRFALGGPGTVPTKQDVSDKTTHEKLQTLIDITKTQPAVAVLQ